MNVSPRFRILYHHRTRSRDGQSVHIDEIVSALKRLGHEVEVIEPQRIAATDEGMEKRLFPQALYELLELGYNILEFAKLSRAVILNRPDFIYERANLFTLSGLWASRLFRLPLLLEVNAPLAEERRRYGRLFWRRLAHWTEVACWKGASVVLPVTEVLAGYLRAVGVPERHITVTPNGVDTDVFRPSARSAAKRSLGVENHLVLGFVGYVREWHGLEEVVDLLANSPALRNAKLFIVGDGPARPAIEARAAQLGVSTRVRFTGIVSHQSLPSFLDAFDIALQPKVTPYASPLKLFEYMAHGCAIVAPAAPNITEILKHGVDACLFAPKSREGFALSIESLAKDEKVRTRLGQAAAAKILERDLTWKGNARRICALAEAVLNDLKAVQAA